MKKRALYVLVLSVLVISLFQPTLHVAAAAEKSADLDGLFFIPGKGWAAVFSLTGKWKSADLKGNDLIVDGKTFNLYCNFRDETHISCTMSSLAPYIGMLATIHFGGQTFGAIVPNRVAGGALYQECPSDTYETVSIRAVTTEGQIITGGISYPADMMTIQEAVQQWIAMVEMFNEVTIESYTITDVSCSAGGEN